MRQEAKGQRVVLVQLYSVQKCRGCRVDYTCGMMYEQKVFERSGQLVLMEGDGELPDRIPQSPERESAASPPTDPPGMACRTDSLILNYRTVRFRYSISGRTNSTSHPDPILSAVGPAFPAVPIPPIPCTLVSMLLVSLIKQTTSNAVFLLTFTYTNQIFALYKQLTRYSGVFND